MGVIRKKEFIPGDIGGKLYDKAYNLRRYRIPGARCSKSRAPAYQKHSINPLDLR
jgi:hypothetical protein